MGCVGRGAVLPCEVVEGREEQPDARSDEVRDAKHDGEEAAPEPIGLAELGLARTGPLDWFMTPDARFVLVRFYLLRVLAIVYLAAFTSSALQNDVLLGDAGLLPARDYLDQAIAKSPPGVSPVRVLPTLFHFVEPSTSAMRAVAWIGVACSLALLCGATNAVLNLVLWALYLSIVQVGQDFYSFGWEIQLCETGLLAVFLAPVTSVRPLSARAPPVVVVWLFRWLVVRVMLGAGLIKLRGDACWTDLTCLQYHYETQPIPGPLSRTFHAMPSWMHAIGVVVNHAVEVVMPLFAFGPRRARLVAGCAFVAFQLVLILSGNLSFLNWLTIVAAIACFDDRAFARITPAWMVAAAARAPKASRASTWTAGGFAILVGMLSLQPIANLFSSRQAMNRSYEPLHIVNTYGAFGAVSRERLEVVLEGTESDDLDRDDAWHAYALASKPGPVTRAPTWITPYQRRLDWQMWFLQFGPADESPWFIRLVGKMLEGDRAVLGMFAIDPFDGRPPLWVRARLYRYTYADGEGAEGEPSDATWHRELVGEYLRPVDRDDPELTSYLEALERRAE